jgi:hypothetical protein
MIRVITSPFYSDRGGQRRISSDKMYAVSISGNEVLLWGFWKRSNDRVTKSVTANQPQFGDYRYDWFKLVLQLLSGATRVNSVRDISFPFSFLESVTRQCLHAQFPSGA